jgi:hypothetical protein
MCYQAEDNDLLRSKKTVITVRKGDFAMGKTISEESNIRWGWLKFMYIYTIIGAGGLGLGIIFIPHVIQSVFKFPGQDPVVFGLLGSTYIALGLVSILALRTPLRFAPILLLQLFLKVIWIIAVIVPYLLRGGLPVHAALLLGIFVTYVIGDLIAIPFAYVFGNGGGSYGGEQVTEVNS